MGKLTWVAVHDQAGLLALARQAASRRQVAATKLNAASSRSHVVLTFRITAPAPAPTPTAAVHKGIQADSTTGTGKSTATSTRVVVSKINVVDLAGSERVKDSGMPPLVPATAPFRPLGSLAKSLYLAFSTTSLFCGVSLFTCRVCYCMCYCA